MTEYFLSKHPIFARTLTAVIVAGGLLWVAGESFARPGFGGGHFGGPHMNIHPGFSAGRGMRPVRPARPLDGGGHRPAPGHRPRPEHRPPHGGGGDHHGGNDHHHDGHHHGRYWPYPRPGYWAGAATGAAAAAIIYNLPAGCIQRVVNGVVYQECGGTWYRPSYAGTQVVYEVVPAP
ncbi:hypothetical protein [uncultured Microbulbifer sp.]|uniref:hypothetical protein n=1 Tax=uncultured Microbulbifer sp. TaxID=348147 RepID=UPI0025D88606|nr:hypothetical protein [uncultured Microbulbifer sp.]